MNEPQPRSEDEPRTARPVLAAAGIQKAYRHGPWSARRTTPVLRGVDLTLAPDAAEAMAQHRGIGNLLLDGRQIKIMSLMEQGRDQQARNMIDATRPTEPWETAIGLLLRAHCHPVDVPVPRADLDHALSEATVLLTHPDPSTAVFQTRTGLTALELEPIRPYAKTLPEVVAEVAQLDAYAAHEVLHHPVAAAALSTDRANALSAVITAAGLGTGDLPAHQRRSLTGVVTHAETELAGLLRTDPAHTEGRCPQE
ncbi:hypothetical protein [Streptomyces calvus]